MEEINGKLGKLIFGIKIDYWKDFFYFDNLSDYPELIQV